MGVVYLAQPREHDDLKVAIKVIKLIMDEPSIARFEVERRSLAKMDHANIAKVFDAGTDATGRPYIVMEYCQGLPLTKYADKHRLSVTD